MIELKFRMKDVKLNFSFRLKAFHPYYLNRFIVLVQNELKNFTSIELKHSFLPRKYETFTVLKSPHVDKKARDQFERITYNRILTFSFFEKENYDNKKVLRLIKVIQNLSFAVGVSLKNKQSIL